MALPQVVSKRGAAHSRLAPCAHVASRSHVVPDLASKRGVTCPPGVREPPGITCSPGITEPGGVARCGVKTWRQLPNGVAVAQNVVSVVHLASGNLAAVAVPEFTPFASAGVSGPGVRERGVRTWRHLLTGVRKPRGVAGRGVRTWRHAPSAYGASQDVASIRGVRRNTPPGTCLENVSSVVGR